MLSICAIIWYSEHLCRERSTECNNICEHFMNCMNDAEKNTHTDTHTHTHTYKQKDRDWESLKNEQQDKLDNMNAWINSLIVKTYLNFDCVFPFDIVNVNMQRALREGSSTTPTFATQINFKALQYCVQLTMLVCKTRKREKEKDIKARLSIPNVSFLF